MTRDEVRELQRSLIALGYALPRYGADGYLGDETYRAAGECALKRGWRPPAAPAAPTPRPDPQVATKFKSSPRRAPITQIVLHWTAGQRDAAGVAETLLAKGYGYHYVVDPLGVCTRLAPHDRVVAHTAGLNEGSIGIALVGLGTGPQAVQSKRWGLRWEPRGVDFLGRKLSLYPYTQPQTESACTLIDSLCEMLSIPEQFPPMVRLSSRDAQSFRGVLGHFHAHLSKNDPGPLIFDALRERGFAEAPIK